MKKQKHTLEIYPSNGKKYNGEPAIISLTSWKARINTVPKTIFSLLQQCPGFHIVLVLSIEEFPQMTKELPEDLMLFVNNNLIEILWVYKNFKSFKKIIFTMNKYKNVPIISADDDCIYKFNYANELYQAWLNNTKNCCCYWCSQYKNTNFYNTSGYATLFPPNYFGNIVNKVLKLGDEIIKFNEDDLLYLCLRIIKKLEYCTCLNKKYYEVAVAHNEISPLHDSYKKRSRKERDKLIDELVDILQKA
jgi:hypothetical protein